MAAVSRPVPPSVPASDRLAAVSLPFRSKPASASTVMAGAAVNSPAAPSVSVPDSTRTTVAAEVLLMVVLPVTMNSPPPSGLSKVPPLLSVTAAVTVPVPLRWPPVRVSRPTVSVKLVVSVAPPNTRSRVSSARRSAAPSVSVPPRTLTNSAVDWPSSRLRPRDSSVPSPSVTPLPTTPPSRS